MRTKDPNANDNRAKIRRFLAEHPDKEFMSIDIAASIGITTDQASDILPILYTDGFVDKRNESRNRRWWRYRPPFDKSQDPFHQFMMLARKTC